MEENEIYYSCMDDKILNDNGQYENRETCKNPYEFTEEDAEYDVWESKTYYPDSSRTPHFFIMSKKELEKEREENYNKKHGITQLKLEL